MHSLRWLPLVIYVVTVFAANWLIINVGIVPVGFGLYAPAGVYAAGLAFSARDITQDTLGRRWTYAAILIGAGLSALLSGPLALASGIAFLLSETSDLLVYTPLRERRWLLAVGTSNVVGLIVDSALFLWLAFGSMEFLAGQVVGKFEMTLLAVVVLWGWRRFVVPERRHQQPGVV